MCGSGVGLFRARGWDVEMYSGVRASGPSMLYALLLPGVQRRCLLRLQPLWRDGLYLIAQLRVEMAEGFHLRV